MSSTNRGANRRPQDLYPTPMPPIDTLLGALDIPATAVFHEPCRGAGAIYDRIQCREKSYCEIAEGKDYLTHIALWPYNLIITNPPFDLALEFLQKSLQEADTVIYLLRLNFLGSQKRRSFWQGNRPSHVLVLANRPCFTGDGKTDSIEYAWFCWDRGGFVTLEPGVHVL
jgi:hypothetical protein